jgi:hypothetical protein
MDDRGGLNNGILWLNCDRSVGLIIVRWTVGFMVDVSA